MADISWIAKEYYAKKNMKKNLILTFISVLLIIIAATGGYFLYPKLTNGQNGNVIQELFGGYQSYAIVPLNSSEYATTTAGVYYLADGNASTTVLLDLTGASKLDLELQVTASSTNSELAWYYEFGNSTSSEDFPNRDRIDYFRETVKSTADGEITHSAAIHTFTPGTTATTTVNVTLDPMASKFIKFTFHCWTANCALWARAIAVKEL